MGDTICRVIALVGLLLVIAGLVADPRLLADEDVGSHFPDQTVTGVIELANDRRDPALIFRLAVSPAGGIRLCRWREPPDLAKTSPQPSGRNIFLDPTNERPSLPRFLVSPAGLSAH